MSYTTLKGFTNIKDKSPSEILEDNLIEFLKWSFIDKGGFFNITRPTSGVYNGEYDNLKCVKDRNYTDGQVWNAFRRDWIWESGTTIGEPIQISGVWVDGVFRSKDSVGTYAHYYDYPNGRVIFDTAISPTAVVELEYSYRWINVVGSDYVPFLRANFDSQRNENITFGSGEYNSYTRIDLPCIAIKVPPKEGTKGYELGSGARYSLNSIICYVIGEDSNSTKRIADILADQAPKNIHLFNTNEIIESGDFPLDYRGMVVDGAKTYPQLVADNENGGYRWHKLFISKSGNTGGQNTQGMFISSVKLDTEIILTQV